MVLEGSLGQAMISEPSKNDKDPLRSFPLWFLRAKAWSLEHEGCLDNTQDLEEKDKNIMEHFSSYQVLIIPLEMFDTHTVNPKFLNFVQTLNPAPPAHGLPETSCHQLKVLRRVKVDDVGVRV